VARTPRRESVSRIKHGAPHPLDLNGGRHVRACQQEVIHLPGPEFNHKFALEAWGAAPRGGMLSILVAIGLIEMISNRSPASVFRPKRVLLPVGFH
jgi:hypothetical protein